jgi:Putative beta barrel porin-7 (BBP7)
LAATGSILVATTGFAVPAKAAPVDCQSIAAPAARLACYDRAFGRSAGSPKRTTAAPSQATQAPSPVAYAPSAPAEPNDRFWYDVGAGAFWVSGAKTSPLLISGSPGSSFSSVLEPVPQSPQFVGVLINQNIANTLTVGNATSSQEAEPGWRPGESVRLGYWLNDQHSQGFDIGGQLINFGGDTVTSSAGGATVAVPYFGGFGTLGVWQPLATTTRSVYVNTTPGMFVHLWSGVDPSVAYGGASGSSSIEAFTVDANYRISLTQGLAVPPPAEYLPTRKGPSPLEYEGPVIDLLAGLRYFGVSSAVARNADLDGMSGESVTNDPVLGLPSSANFVNSTFAAGSVGYELSAFNNFVGPQLGLSGVDHWGRFWISGDAKAAVGATIESINVATSGYITATISETPTTTIYPAPGIPLRVATGPPVVTTITAPGTILQQVYTGSRSKTVFAALPSLALTGGYEIVPNSVSLTLGYSAYYLTDAALAAAQGGSQLKQSAFWAQGVTLGVRGVF